MGRDDDPHVGAERRAAADALEGSLLQKAQQLGLERQRQLARLVEEERAAVGRLDLAGHAAVGAREAPALVAEELALDERVGERRAVDRDEGAVASPSVRVNRPRKQALSDARLAAEEHRRVDRRRARHLLVHPPHRRARAHDVVEHAAHRHAARGALARAQRGAVEGQRDLAREGLQERPRRRARTRPRVLVEHLEHAARRTPAVAYGHREERAGDEARLAVDAAEVARVLRRVGEVRGRARLGHPARDPLPRRQSDLVRLGQVGHAGAEASARGVDEPHRGALGPHGARDARADGAEERVEVDLLREQRAEVEQQRELVFPLDHRVGGYHGDRPARAHAARALPPPRRPR